MGVETAAFTLAAISAGATIGKMSAEKQAADSNLSAINQQSKLLALQYQEKTIHNLDVTEKVLQHQAAQLSTRGVAFSSPSFNAVQRETINIGAKNEAKIKTEKSLSEAGLDIERRNVKSTLHSQLFGDIASFAFGAVDLYDKLPQSEEI